jgi:O-antigen/teichoic acid export membrane protein
MTANNGATLATLKQRIFKAGVWTATGYFLSQGIRFASNLVLTRLLLPEMFGVMAVASMVMYGLAMISDIGLTPNIVYSKRGNDPVFLNTAWAIQIRRGVLISFVAIGVSLLIAVAGRAGIFKADSVYANRQLPYLIAAISICAVIEGFESTKMLEARRNLANHLITKIEISSQIAGLICMLAWVAISRSVWALVAGSICSTLVRAIQSHIRLPGTKNRWLWDDVAFHEIIHFGKWIFLSSILGFLVSAGDRILLGGMITATLLGVYAIAQLITSSIENMLSKLLTDVSFPALSEVARERPSALKASYYRFHVIVTSPIYLVAGGLMSSGHTLVALLYDRRYQEAGWMLDTLAAILLTLPIRVVQQCFQALGMPQLLSNITAVRLAALYLMTPIGFHFFGIHGAIWGIVLSNFACVPPTVLYAVRHGLFDVRKELYLLWTLPVGIFLGKLFNLAVASA